MPHLTHPPLLHEEYKTFSRKECTISEINYILIIERPLIMNIAHFWQKVGFLNCFHHFLKYFRNRKNINHKKQRWYYLPALNHLRSNIFSRTNFLFLAALGAKSFIIPSFLVTVQSSTETNQQNVNNVIKLPLFNRFVENENWLSLQKCRGLVGNKKGLFLLFGKPIDQWIRLCCIPFSNTLIF